MTTPQEPDEPRDESLPEDPSGERPADDPRPWSYEDRPEEDRPPRGPEHHHAGQPPYYQVPQTSGIDQPRRRPMHIGRMGSPWYSWWLLLIPAGALLLMFIVFLIFALG